MSRQPNWKLIANLGDVNPLNYGGYFVYEDTTGVYPPEAEKLFTPENEGGEYTVYRFILEPCTFINGILSDNPHHPEISAWFAKPEAERATRPQDTTYLKSLIDYNRIPEETLIGMFCSPHAVERALAWEIVGQYHGWANLDQYPLTLSEAEARARYNDQLAALKAEERRSNHDR